MNQGTILPHGHHIQRLQAQDYAHFGAFSTNLSGYVAVPGRDHVLIVYYAFRLADAHTHEFSANTANLCINLLSLHISCLMPLSSTPWAA